MEGAVAVFLMNPVLGEVVATPHRQGVKILATFKKLPPGKHGFHIHKAGDLRGEGCLGLCEHYDIGGHKHGGPPTTKGERHTGDLGNVTVGTYRYYLPRVRIQDLWGRSIIVHEGEDDLGKGGYDDSLTTGHSGKRMGCAIFGRMMCPTLLVTRHTRKK
jgi:Cu/Zn superoxide dismutase